MEKSISYGRNDCKVIDSGLFGSSETILITPSSLCDTPPVRGEISLPVRGVFCSMLGELSEGLRDCCASHVQTTLPVWTAFHVVVQHKSFFNGHEHPPPHPTYFTTSTIFSLYDEVTEKYFKADSSNPGEKLFTLSISSPHV